MTFENINFEGFWRDHEDFKQATNTDVFPLWPMPCPDDWAKQAFVDKLRKAEEKADWMPYKGYSLCRICRRNNGTSDITLTHKGKTWRWPDGFLHYIGTHDVKPTNAFIAFIEGFAAGEEE